MFPKAFKNRANEITSVEVPLRCRPSRAPKQALEQPRPMVYTRNQIQHRTRKPVDLVESPNKVFEGRSTKGPHLLLHQWRPRGRQCSMFFGLMRPGCQRPPSNFSGSFACKSQAGGTKYLVQLRHNAHISAFKQSLCQP